MKKETIVILIILVVVILSCTLLFRNAITKQTLPNVVNENDYTRVIQLKELYDSSNKSNEKKISGDFIQCWLCNDWTQADWNEHIQELKNVGIDYLIIQNIADIKDGNYSYIGFWTKSIYDEQTNKGIAFQYSGNLLNKALSAAKKYDVKVFIGLPYDNAWFDGKSVYTEEWQNTQVALVERAVKEIYRNQDGGINLEKEYSDVIAGWYIPYECYTVESNEQKTDEWIKLFNKVIAVLHNETPEMPIMVDGYFNTYAKISVEETKKQYAKLYDGMNLRKNKDIVTLQDGLGTLTNYDVTYVRDCIRAFSEVTKERNLKLWIIVENFTPGSGAASTERVDLQRKINSNYAEQLIMFSYSHYYSKKVLN